MSRSWVYILAPVGTIFILNAVRVLYIIVKLYRFRSLYDGWRSRGGKSGDKSRRRLVKLHPGICRIARRIGYTNSIYACLDNARLILDMGRSPQHVLDDLDRLTSEYRRQFLLYPAIRLSKLRRGKVSLFGIIAIIANLLTIAMVVEYILDPASPGVIKKAFRDICMYIVRLFS